jgi:valyl-tRNA synthetase
MSTYHLGQVPFRTVMIHGLVRDKQGQKFSKSLNNGIDPLDMIEKYGADALRMGLLMGTAIGNDISFDEDKIRGYKHFANKLWNISRFILTHTTDIDTGVALTSTDTKKLKVLQQKVAEVSEDIESFRLYLAAEKVYHFVWHELADVLLEESKPILLGEDVDQRKSRQVMLREYLITSLKMLHPFMPYITEAIWQELPKNVRGNEHNILMVAKWPTQ